MPPAPGLTGSTLRQVLHVSAGGPMVRLWFSNAFGGTPLAITSAHIARSQGGSAIDLAGDRRLTFGGADSVRIAPGATATSDPLAYDVAALSDLAVTIQIGAAPAEVTGSGGKRRILPNRPATRIMRTLLSGAWRVQAVADRRRHSRSPVV